MSETNRIDAESIAAWIERERDKLLPGRQEPGATTGGGRPHDELARRWLDLARLYLEGLLQYAGEGPASGPAFGLSDELVGTWRAAWMNSELMGDSATARLAELLGRLPPIGLAREHTEAWRELAHAHLECRRLEQEFKAVLIRVQAETLALLEEKVRERDKTTSPIGSFRDLYDLWVECGEQVYAKVAHSDSYCRLQGELGNATMRFRSRQQKVLEHAAKQLDLPTRSELNSVHRQLRALRAELNDAPDDSEHPARPVSTAGRPKKPAKTTRRAKRARRATRRASR